MGQKMKILFEWDKSRGKKCMRRKSGYRMNVIITLLPVLILVVLYVLEFDTGHVQYVDVRICESEIYSMDEIEEAVSALKCYFFLNMPGSELRALTYEEEESTPQYIVFISDYVERYHYDGTEENNRERHRRWTMIPDSKTGKWRVRHSVCP